MCNCNPFYCFLKKYHFRKFYKDSSDFPLSHLYFSRTLLMVLSGDRCYNNGIPGTTNLQKFIIPRTGAPGPKDEALLLKIPLK